MNAGKEKKVQKLSYEELNAACAEMSQQLQNQQEYIKKLYKSHQELAAALQAKRLDYLFKVVELYKGGKLEEFDCTFPMDFVRACIAEIEDTLTITEEAKEEN